MLVVLAFGATVVHDVPHKAWDSVWGDRDSQRGGGRNLCGANGQGCPSYEGASWAGWTECSAVHGVALAGVPMGEDFPQKKRDHGLGGRSFPPWQWAQCVGRLRGTGVPKKRGITGRGDRTMPLSEKVSCHASGCYLSSACGRW